MVTTLYIIACFFILFFVVILFIMFFWMGSAMMAKVPFISVPNSILPDIEKALEIKKDSIVCDLGCGDARVLFYLAKNNPDSKFIGIENSSFPYAIAKLNLWLGRKKGNAKNVQILKQDFFNYDLKEVTHIFVYLYPNVMDDMLGKLDRELKGGSRLVSASFKFTQKKPLFELDLERKKMQLARNLIVYEF
jgi:precorrin-6B methylase 2